MKRHSTLCEGTYYKIIDKKCVFVAVLMFRIIAYSSVVEFQLLLQQC
jgi:hypothetical protein